MIRSVLLQNFQSLADVELDLGGLTVVVGPSNSGKSAVRRAIESAATNAASTGRLRAGTKAISVVVRTNAGSVHWEKGKGVNCYETRTADDVPLVQDKPGSTITPEAAAILGLGEINFAGQFDAPFLLTDSPSNVAKRLGDLTNISVLFDGIREATRRKREAAQKAKLIEEQAAHNQSELEALVPELQAEQEKLTLAAQVLDLAGRADGQAVTLAAYCANAYAAQRTLEAAQTYLASVPTAEPAEELLERLEAASQDVGNLDGAVLYAQRLQAQIVAAQAALSQATEDEAHTLAEFNQIESCPMCGQAMPEVWVAA